MAFSFGAPSTNAPAPSGGGFNFGAPPAGGFSFTPAPAAPAPAAGGFSFGGAPATDAGASKPAASGFNFGGEAASDSNASKPATSGFTFGAPAAAAGDKPAATGGFSFGGVPAASTGDAKTPASAAGGFSFGGAAAEEKAPAATGNDKPVASAGFSFGAPAPAVGGDKPAATTGFSFGGASAPAPAADTKAPAPAAGGFSFGGAAAPKPAESTAAPAASGGFSFGGATKDAAKDSTSAAPAPATTTPGAKSGFSFGGVDTPAPKAPSPVKTPADTAATPGLATPAAKPAETATNKLEMIEPPPIEYQSLTVEQILNRFQSELETDTIAFLQEAQRIAHYDATLRNTQHSLSELTNMVSRLMVHQSEVDIQLQGIGSYQSELATTLDQLEQNVDELFAAQSGISVQDADIERERAYERALEVDSKLGQMANVLENVNSDLNAAQERVFSMSGRGPDGYGKDEEVGKIIGIFNAHNETLAQLEAKARALEADVTMVGQVLARSGH